MAIALNRLSAVCEEIAKAEGKLSRDSSSRALVYEMSRNWRILCDSTRQIRAGQQWSDREKAASALLITVLGYLHRIGCRDIERLVKDSISRLAPVQ